MVTAARHIVKVNTVSMFIQAWKMSYIWPRQDEESNYDRRRVEFSRNLKGKDDDWAWR